MKVSMVSLPSQEAPMAQAQQSPTGKMPSKQPQAQKIANTVSCAITKNQAVNGDLIPNTQKGSNQGGIFMANNGCKYYLKEISNNIDRAEQEVLASKLYQAAGVKCADVELAKYNHQNVLLSSWIAGGVLSQAGKIPDVIKEKLQNGFAIDAWLANWDVVGQEFDNIIIDVNNEPVRIDTGGSLEYRAMGKKKAFSANKVDEFSTLRNPTINPNTASVFQYISNEKLESNLRTLESIKEETIIQTVKNYITDQISGERLIIALIGRRKKLIELIKQEIDNRSHTSAAKGGRRTRKKRRTKRRTKCRTKRRTKRNRKCKKTKITRRK